MKSYRDLEVFTLARQLAIRVHKLTLTLPKHEMYEEGSQVRRSSKAIAAAIVEGYGRRIYKADFQKYLVFAMAECDETILHLDFLFETGSLADKVAFDFLRGEYERLGKMINGFYQCVDSNWIPGSKKSDS